MSAFRITLETGCTCGDVLKVSASSEETVMAIEDFFRQFHEGEGHHPTTAKEATRARLRQRRRAADDPRSRTARV